MNLMAMLQNVIMNNSNPMLANAIQLAQNGDKEGVEKIARNIKGSLAELSFFILKMYI